MTYTKFYTKSGEKIKYHKRSSVWPRIKFAEPINKPFIGWIIGNGKKINFWRDTWATSISLREHIDLPNHLWKLCKAKVSDFINRDGWNFPTDISLALLAMGISISSITYNPNSDDLQNWNPDIHGNFSVKNAFESTRNRIDTAWWWKYTCFQWKLMNQILPTDDLIQRKGIQLVSVINHCGLTAESANHLFFECNVAKVLWSWATSTFNIAAVDENNSWKPILDKSKALSLYPNDLWITMVFSVSRWLWNARNTIRFDETKLTI
ncbi:hypothetical protein GIB67_021133 [Kingdonia uniflora]|uniref:Reverse transcriptase zinc-binding domain-containing protein n=1 Tax=Kingdonia uniflora TaxID=39325 RepID=A0A7J7N7I0_9MAGN|nr:hypothetical protein GIB67_021133 [Kingdonia uniflora]